MSLKYLVTILYRPRETMRRILESAQRWDVQVVMLAFVAASVNDINAQDAAAELPGLRLGPGLALVALGIIVGAIVWAIALYIVAWIATPIGRMLGGTGSVRDVRAALAWGLVPVVWSVLYRLPLTIYAGHLHLSPQTDSHRVIREFLSHGGCSIIVLFFFFQLLFAVASIVLGSFTVAEAQKFSTEKGFVNVICAIVLPFLVIAAAVFTFRH
jgi:hypothetical protein